MMRPGSERAIPTPTEARVLKLLELRPLGTLREHAKELGIAKETVIGHLRALEAMGLVEHRRYRSPSYVLARGARCHRCGAQRGTQRGTQPRRSCSQPLTNCWQVESRSCSAWWNCLHAQTQERWRLDHANAS